MQRYMMRGGKQALAAKSLTTSFKHPIVRKQDRDEIHHSLADLIIVDRDEVDRLRKRFMKLDKVCYSYPVILFVSTANHLFVSRITLAR